VAATKAEQAAMLAQDPLPPIGARPAKPDERRTALLAAAAIGGAVIAALAVALVVVATGGDEPSTRVEAEAEAEEGQDGTSGAAADDEPTGGDETSADDTAEASGPVDELAVADVDATSTAPPGEEADGSQVSYAPAQVLDGERNTAWRTPGDGTGVVLTLDLGEDREVTRVGLLPGYAKTDPTDGSNRFYENRRVTSVVWRFDDGTEVPQSLTQDAEVQGQDVPATTTRYVEVEITGVTAPGIRDFTPISEIDVVGR
jgi:hypothetical protein